MPYQKQVISGKISKESKKAYKAAKQAAKEQEIYILFDSDVDYTIEKLSTDGLPEFTTDQRPITWLNNFVIRLADGSDVNGVEYSVLFDAPDNAAIFVYDDAGLRTHTGPVNSRAHKNKNWKEIRLSKGDPAIGIAS